MGYILVYNSYSFSRILRNIIPKQVKIITDGHKSQTDHKSSTSSEEDEEDGSVQAPFFYGIVFGFKQGRDTSESSSNIAMKSSVDRKIRYRFFFSLFFSFSISAISLAVVYESGGSVCVCVCARVCKRQINFTVKKKDFLFLFLYLSLALD